MLTVSREKPAVRTRKTQRLVLVAGALALLGTASGLVLASLSQNLAFFASPTDIVTGVVTAHQRLRLGGLVVEGSVARDGTMAEFELTDLEHAVAVRFEGLLPDLFREGQGIVALGTIAADGIFRADEVLAKHDEGYMPPEVTDALKDADHWLSEN